MKRCERAKTTTSYAECKGTEAKKMAKARFKSCQARARSIKGQGRKAKTHRKKVLEQCLRGGGGSSAHHPQHHHRSSYSEFAREYAPSPRPRGMPWHAEQSAIRADRERLLPPNFDGWD